jgi:hypothetical protein
MQVKTIVSFMIGLAMCTAAHAQAVQWPAKKVRVEDGAALIVLAQKMRAELGQENADLAQTNTTNEDSCLERIEDVSGHLYDEERQTWRLATVGMYVVNPVDEETIAGALFDELHDATDTLKVVHQVVGLATQFCSKSTKVIGVAVRVEALEGEYQRIVATLHERIGPTRPGPPSP